MTPQIIQTIIICLVAVAIACFGFKAFQKVGTKAVEAPKDLVEAGGEAVRKTIEAIGGEIRDLLGATPEIALNRTVIQLRQLASDGLREVLSRICERRNMPLTISYADETQWSFSTIKRLKDRHSHMYPGNNGVQTLKGLSTT
jgi:hypothetical protein